MRILTLTKFYHPYRGGIETVCKNITESNIEAGFVSDVLCANTVFKNSEELQGSSRIIRSARLVSAKSTSLCPFMPWQLRSLIPQYDLIHVHFPDPMTALSLFLCKPNIPFVIHWHSDIIKQKKLMTFFGPLQRWCLEHAKSIIVTSQAYLDHSYDLAPFKHKVTVAPIGIRSSAPFRERKLSHNKDILAVGRLTSYKGFNDLIKAATLLPSNYRVTIIGDGELKEELRAQIAHLQLEDKVILAGQKNHVELQEYFEKADLFCLPSTMKSEAFGVVLVEAMSYSLPIVACNIEGSGVPWVSLHGKNGLNVETSNPSALAKAIQEILDDSNKHQHFSRNSFQRFQDEFQLIKMMDKIRKAYR